MAAWGTVFWAFIWPHCILVPRAAGLQDGTMSPLYVFEVSLRVSLTLIWVQVASPQGAWQ